MPSDPDKLREFNSQTRVGTQVFTACIELMLPYRWKDTLAPGRPGVRHAYHAMLGPVRERVNLYLDTEYGKRKKIRKDTFELLPHSLDLSTPDGDGGIRHLTLLRGSGDDMSDLFFDWHDSDEGYLQLCLPMEEVLEDPQRYLRLCLDAAAELPFTFGLAGFSMNHASVFINGNEHLAAPVIGRFPGVNVMHVWRYCGIDDGLPTLNWLTFVPSAQVERLGGLARLQSRATAGVVVHPLRHGAAVQAGPRPLLGDVNQRESLEAYYQVGALLEAVKSATQLPSNIAGGSAEATEWGHRFFRKPA